MRPKDFNDSQQQALLDLALLAMYADGHLAAAEDNRVHRLLTDMGCGSESELNRRYDAAVGRISRDAGNPESARRHAVTLAGKFATPAERQAALQVIQDLVASDSNVAPQEATYLTAVRAALQG